MQRTNCACCIALLRHPFRSWCVNDRFSMPNEVTGLRSGQVRSGAACHSVTVQVNNGWSAPALICYRICGLFMSQCSRRADGLSPPEGPPVHPVWLSTRLPAADMIVSHSGGNSAGGIRLALMWRLRPDSVRLLLPVVSQIQLTTFDKTTSWRLFFFKGPKIITTFRSSVLTHFSSNCSCFE